MQRATRTGQAVHGEEYDIVHLDGTESRRLEYATPFDDERGQVRGCVRAFVDATNWATCWLPGSEFAKQPSSRNHSGGGGRASLAVGDASAMKRFSSEWVSWNSGRFARL